MQKLKELLKQSNIADAKKVETPEEIENLTLAVIGDYHTMLKNSLMVMNAVINSIHGLVERGEQVPEDFIKKSEHFKGASVAELQRVINQILPVFAYAEDKKQQLPAASTSQDAPAVSQPASLDKPAANNEKEK